MERQSRLLRQEVTMNEHAVLIPASIARVTVFHEAEQAA
jgi:hypothetical protein